MMGITAFVVAVRLGTTTVVAAQVGDVVLSMTRAIEGRTCRTQSWVMPAHYCRRTRMVASCCLVESHGELEPWY